MSGQDIGGRDIGGRDMSNRDMSDRAPAAYRRLILDLYHGAADAETLRAAAEFARLLGLDMHCLFIEDEAVLALAAFPFAREIRLPTHEWTPLNTDTLATELRQTAAQARRLMDEIIRSVGVASEFEVLSGDPAACIAAICEAGDIVVVAEPSLPAARAAYGVTRLHEAAHASAAVVLLLPARMKSRRGPVVAVLTDAADASLDVACRIAVAAHEGVTILLPEAVRAEAGDRLRERGRALGLRHEQIRLHATHGNEADDLLRALAGTREHIIVMVRDGSAMADAASASRIATVRGVPVLLIKAETQGGEEPG